MKALWRALLALAVCLVLAGPDTAGAQGQWEREHLGRADGATSADGLRIVFTDVGSGETALVFIHCWSCDLTYWNEQRRFFADRYRVVTLDLAGHGFSGAGRRDWTVANYAQDVRAVVEKLDLKRVVLIGHSMGGYVAVAAAGLMPGRVVAVIGVDTLQDAERVLTPEMTAPFVAQMQADFPGFTDKFVRQMFPADADSALVTRVASDMASAPPEVAIPSLTKMFDYDLKAGFAALTCPVRCLNSDRNPTNVEGNRKYARDFDVVLLKGSGHFPHLERPAEFDAALSGVLAQVLAPKPK